MIYALTGTPGTGKTTVAELLSEPGMKVISLHDLLQEGSLLQDYDEDFGSYDVDIDEAAELMIPLLEDGETILVEGHLSHLLPCDSIIVLRCNPFTIKERLENRGYSSEKVYENMEAEALDVILVESIETSRPTFEVDGTSLDPEEVVQAVMSIIKGEGHKYLPGNVDWSEELLKWC